MKKIFTILSIVLLGAISCTKSSFETPKPEETGLVEVNMSMTLPTWLMASTKASDMAHKPNIDDIRVAMFGTSGYPQAYTKATLTGTQPTENGTTYTFTVLLPVYEGEAHIHVIANGPDSILYDGWPENKLMTKMTTTGGVGAYWARIVLEDGVQAKWTGNGTMQTYETTGNFVPTDATSAKFQNITLIRNFAEVALTEVNGLTDVTYTLVNVPTSGSVAPIFSDSVKSEPKSATDTTTLYYADYLDTYATGYQYNTSTEKMEEISGSAVYDGYMVDESINKALPADGALPYSISNPAFTYERTVATRDATCLLIRGRYTDNKYYYYRLDLLGQTAPLALYRNYQYQVRIGRLGGKGYTTPDEAMKHNSSDNVSALVEAKTLTDISDGASRLYVEYIEKNFVAGGPQTFWVKYEPSADGEVNNTSVTITDVKCDAITSAGVTKGTASGDYQFFNFTLNGQGAADKVSTFTVKASNGKTGDYASTLTRVVTVRVVKTMTMTPTLNHAEIEGGKDKNVVLSIALSDTLQSSMFPLEFYIEDTNHTLNPTGSDGAGHEITVPVKVDKSIVDKTSNSFYFIRTVNWSEYEPMRDAYKAGNTGAIVFQTEFKTLVDDSATDIYVANEYFTTANTSLTNTAGTVRKTGSFTFTPSMFSTTDRTETSTDGHVTVTFSSVTYAGATASYIQLANNNTQPTATFSTDASKTKVLKVTVNYDNCNGSVTTNAAGGVDYDTESAIWPGNGTQATNNLVLTFTRGYNNYNYNRYHYITSIVVEYEYYE